MSGVHVGKCRCLPVCKAAPEGLLRGEVICPQEVLMAVHSVVQAGRLEEAIALLNRPLWPWPASQACHLPHSGGLSL